MKYSLIRLLFVVFRGSFVFGLFLASLASRHRVFFFFFLVSRGVTTFLFFLLVTFALVNVNTLLAVLVSFNRIFNA
jgi:hypothetical protein